MKVKEDIHDVQISFSRPLYICSSEKSLLCHFSISFIWRSLKALRMNVLALKNLFFKQIHRNGVEYSIFGCTSNSDLDIAVSKENYITRPKFDLTVRSSLSTLFLSLRKMRRRVT